MNTSKGCTFASARKVAGYLDVSERLVRQKAATGEWPSYCIGGRRVFDVEEIVALVKGGASSTDEPDTGGQGEAVEA